MIREAEEIFAASPEGKAYREAAKAVKAAPSRSQEEQEALARFRIARDRLAARFPVLQVPEGDP